MKEPTMDLMKLQTDAGPRWAVDGKLLPAEFHLGLLMDLLARNHASYLSGLATHEAAQGTPLAPIEPFQEVWASGVTYLRSREAREAESATGDIYQRVYSAERPELFYKASGWRVVGAGGSIRVRRDSRWNVPEPELTLLINRQGEICGYTAGNDVSSRDIEGDNPLYLPQAKVYNGSCALGPAIRLVSPSAALTALTISLKIERGGVEIFAGETSTRLIQRSFTDLVAYLTRELAFPHGVFLMTGTGIVPPETYSLKPGDEVRVCVGDLELRNPTA
jgi:2-dehydro-3-deoxy-D-arabinonate dehydratase